MRGALQCRGVSIYAVSAVVIWSTLAATAKSLLTTIPAFGALFLSSLTAPRGRAEQVLIMGGILLQNMRRGRG